MPERRSSFEEIQAAGEELRMLLSAHGIALQPNSILATAFANVELATRYWRSQLLPTEEAGERLIADLAAVQALAAVVPDIKRCAMGPGLLERLRALGRGDPRLTSRGEQSGDRDAVFELLCWHVCMQFAEDVTFGEPDIRCRYGGHRFGIACKAHYGGNGRAIKAIRKGWGQALLSRVEHGIVMMHLTNHFPHDQMSAPGPSGSVFAAGDEASLNKLFERSLTATCSPIAKGLLTSLRANAKDTKGRFHGVLYVAHSLAPFRGTRYRVGGTEYQRIGSQPPDDAWRFMKNLNAFWQDLDGSSTVAV